MSMSLRSSSSSGGRHLLVIEIEPKQLLPLILIELIEPKAAQHAAHHDEPAMSPRVVPPLRGEKKG